MRRRRNTTDHPASGGCSWTRDALIDAFARQARGNSVIDSFDRDARGDTCRVTDGLSPGTPGETPGPPWKSVTFAERVSCSHSGTSWAWAPLGKFLLGGLFFEFGAWTDCCAGACGAPPGDRPGDPPGDLVLPTNVSALRTRGPPGAPHRGNFLQEHRSFNLFFQFYIN